MTAATRPYRRWVARALLCIMGGAVATLSVAWISAALSDPFSGTLVERACPITEGASIDDTEHGSPFFGMDRQGRSLSTSELCSWAGVRRSWHVWQLNTFPAYSPSLSFDYDWERHVIRNPRTPQEGERLRHQGKRWGVVVDSLDDVLEQVRPPLFQEARGWPWLAFWSEMEPKDGGEWRVAGGWALAYPKHPSAISLRVLPYRPIWSGLLANLAAFSLLWALAFLALPEWRRARRRGRGLCERCRYDLCGQAAAGCPECGWNRE